MPTPKKKTSNHLPTLEPHGKRNVALCTSGKLRLDIASFSVRTYTSQGDFSDTKFKKPYAPAETLLGQPEKTSRGKDKVGAFILSEYSAANGPVRGRLALKTYPEKGLALVSASASNADPGTWWMGCHFGLSGEGTVVYRLRLPGFAAGLATFMNEEWWSHPCFPSKPEEVFTQSRFLSWREKDGTYGCILPLSGGEFVSHLRGIQGGLEVRSSSYDDACAKASGPSFVAAFGTDPYEVVDRASRAAMEFIGGTARPRTEKKFPEPLEYLGWCTWDAFYRDVNEKGVLKQLESFRRKGIPARFVLLDDGWYEMKDNQMMGAFNDPKKFPGGLKPVIQKAKKKFGIKYVGAWHALTGYWMGIHPENHLPKPMQDLLLNHKHLPPAPPVELEKASRFYGTWHTWLKSQGVDFVKVDGQSHLLRYCRNEVPLAQGAASNQKALQGSVAKNFHDWMINCMSMSQDQCWNYHKSNVTRSSDDYMLNGVESDPLDHARINAYNSYWMAPISWADWDMFWSSSPNRVLHQALRAVSGGPVYVSDKVGTSHADILKPLCLADGRLLRCDLPGQPSEDCLFTDPRKMTALKIVNKAGDAGVLCLVQAGKKPAVSKAAFRPSDIHGLAGEDFAVWNFHLKLGCRMARTDAWEVPLQKRGVSLFIAQPIRDGFAAIGITDKLIAPKTVASCKVGAKDATVGLKTGGRFAAFSKRLPVAVLSNGRNLPYEYKEGWLIVTVPDEKAVEIRIVF